MGDKSSVLARPGFGLHVIVTTVNCFGSGLRRFSWFGQKTFEQRTFGTST